MRARSLHARLTRRRPSRGQSLVEFALVTPLLLLVLAGAADLGRAFYAYVAIENAAKEGAFFGSRAPLCDDGSATGCSNPNNVVWRVRNELTGIRNPDGTELTPTIQCASPVGTVRTDLRNCESGDTYTVGLVYPFHLVTPILGSIVGTPLNLRTTSSAVVLNLAFDPSPGAGPQKLVLASGARNGTDIVLKCTEPDDFDAAGFYRSPCRDTSTGDPSDVLHVRFETGDTIRYKITVRNSGAVTLSGLSIGDSLGWPGSCPSRPSTLAVNAEYVCEYVRTAPTVPGSAAEFEYVNQLTVDANEVNPATDDVTVVVQRPPGELRVLKWLSPYRLGSDGNGVPTFGTLDSISIGYNATIPAPYVWYRVIVTNVGGSPAPGIQVTDSFGSLPYGQNSATAVCDAAPTTLAVGASFECRYRRSFGASSTNPTTNRVWATSTDTSVIQSDDATATVNVAACTGTNKVVPSLIGLNRTTGPAAWTAAGFTGTYNNFNGNGTVVTQSRQAFSCMAASTSISVTK
jgi:hypothetical protein